MRVRLIKKLADRIDDIDLRAHNLGDTLDLTRSEARLLIAEGWAVRDAERRQFVSLRSHRAVTAGRAAEQARRKTDRSR